MYAVSVFLKRNHLAEKGSWKSFDVVEMPGEF